MEQNVKVCFKCHRELPLDMFYKHPQMADGHLNKCKECTKKDVHDKYMYNIENPEYVEKERERCREKYKRLGRRKIDKPHDIVSKKANSLIRRRIQTSIDYDVHHWNYDYPYDVFIISKRWHSRIHKKLKYDEFSKLFLFNNVLLDTKEKHEKAIREILSLSNNCIVESVNIEDGVMVLNNSQHISVRDIKQHNEKRCACYKKSDNSLIKIYSSLREAERDSGVCIQTIISQCQGKRKSRTDVYWKYID